MIKLSHYITLKWMAGCLLIAAMVLAGSSMYLSTKSWLAQILLHRAWTFSVHTGENTRPWHWADMHTIARLSFPHLDKSFVVLNSASGQAMAFGPGLVAGDPKYAQNQTLAIGGHRDTHLAVLQHMKLNEPVELQTVDGYTYRYRLTHTRVVDASKDAIGIATDAAGLVLITCYPFSATQTGGSLRMVAVFTPEPSQVNKETESLT